MEGCSTSSALWEEIPTISFYPGSAYHSVSRSHPQIFLPVGNYFPHIINSNRQVIIQLADTHQSYCRAMNKARYPVNVAIQAKPSSVYIQLE